MKRKISALLLTLLIFVSTLLPSMEVATAQRRRPIRRNSQPASSSANYVTARFNQLADEYLKGYYSFNPSAATAAGLHEYDSQLETRSPEALAREMRRLRDTVNLLTRINPIVLTEETRYDYLVLMSHARGQLFDLQDIRAWQRDPNVYNQLISEGVDNILKRNYAPIEQRLNSVLAREREIVRLL